MRENAATKARRLLVEGRVAVREVGDDIIRADVRGDSAEIRQVVYAAGWSCSCPARAHCSHVQAVMLCTLVKGGLT